MKVKNAEFLRQEYNNSYSQPYDRWSCIDTKKAQTIVQETIKQIAKYEVPTRKINKVLDVGCAKGYITEAFRLAGFEAHGLDYSDVAIELATKNFPLCHFQHMDGFNPNYEINFDLIFVRGFSGCNTHNLDFVADFSNRYINILNPGGFYILAYPSNFSGSEKSGETVNWSWPEMERLTTKLKAKYQDVYFIPPKTLFSEFKKNIKLLVNKKTKDYFHLIYQKI